VLVVTEEFVSIAQRLAAHHGFADLATVVLPYPLEGRPEQEVRSIAADAYPRLLVALGARD
jgi:hypothetical protein